MCFSSCGARCVHTNPLPSFMAIKNVFLKTYFQLVIHKSDMTMSCQKMSETTRNKPILDDILEVFLLQSSI